MNREEAKSAKRGAIVRVKVGTHAAIALVGGSRGKGKRHKHVMGVFNYYTDWPILHYAVDATFPECHAWLPLRLDEVVLKKSRGGKSGNLAKQGKRK